MNIVKLSKLQDFTAQSLGMERSLSNVIVNEKGKAQRKSTTNKKRLDTHEFKEAKKIENETVKKTKSNTKEDMDYFDRNTMNVKNYLLNNIKNIEKLPNQKITKVDGKIKIEITDLKETEYGSLDSIEIYYQLNKGINYIFNRTVVYDNSTKKYKVTDNLVFNSEEKIELPKLMPQGTQLKLIRE